MTIEFLCPNGHALAAPDARAGRPGKCPKCRMAFIVPTMEEYLEATADEDESIEGLVPEPLADAKSAASATTATGPSNGSAAGTSARGADRDGNSTASTGEEATKTAPGASDSAARTGTSAATKTATSSAESDTATTAGSASAGPSSATSTSAKPAEAKPAEAKPAETSVDKQPGEAVASQGNDEAVAEAPVFEAVSEITDESNPVAENPTASGARAGQSQTKSPLPTVPAAPAAPAGAGLLRLPKPPTGLTSPGLTSPGLTSPGLTPAAGKSPLIVFLCPNGHKLHGPATLKGKPGQCPHCGSKFRVPDDDDDSEEEIEVSQSQVASAERPHARPAPARTPQGVTDHSLRDRSDQEIPVLQSVPNWQVPPPAVDGGYRLQDLFAWIWEEKDEDASVEIHLVSGEVYQPNGFATQLSRQDVAVFRTVKHGKSDVRTIRWEDVRQVVIRDLSDLPDSLFRD